MDRSQFGGNMPLPGRRTTRSSGFGPKQTYTIGGPLKVSGAGPILALVALGVNLALFAWFVYFFVCIAGYVNAWPF